MKQANGLCFVWTNFTTQRTCRFLPRKEGRMPNNNFLGCFADHFITKSGHNLSPHLVKLGSFSSPEVAIILIHLKLKCFPFLLWIKRIKCLHYCERNSQGCVNLNTGRSNSFSQPKTQELLNDSIILIYGPIWILDQPDSSKGKLVSTSRVS